MKYTRDQLREAFDAVREHGKIAVAARKLRIARTTLADRYYRAVSVFGQPGDANEVEQDARLQRATDEKQALERRYKSLLATWQDQQQKLADILRLADVAKTLTARPLRVEDTGKPGQSTAFAIASDWHLEEPIDPKTVNGLNEYNLGIADARIQSFFRNVLKLVEMCRKKSVIDTMVLGFLGDLISGYIHDELLETNQLSPTEASLRSFEYMRAGIEFFLEHGGFKKIVVPCCFGNHGRTTKRPRVSTGYKNNFEWMIYHFLAAHYLGHPKVQVQVADGMFVYVNVYNTVVRCSHGDGIQYRGGVGGIHIPLRKAIAQWNKARKADLDVMGHWHTRQSSRDYVVNGSGSGYGPFSIYIKADYEPPCQSFFLIHPRYGKTVEAPVLLRDK